MKKYAIIVAGGSGLRMGASVPKQFLLVCGKTIIYHSIKAFIDAYDDIEIALVLPKIHFDLGQQIIQEFKQQIHLIEGGETRFQSVKNGLSVVKKLSVVFVHDAVRCLVTKHLIQNCYNSTILNGNAVPAIACVDSMRLVNETSNSIFPRSSLRIIQTPQTFFSTQLLTAFEQPFNQNFTDEASVVEYLGEPIFLCEGETTNIKITTPIDLFIAEAVFKQRTNQ